MKFKFILALFFTLNIFSAQDRIKLEGKVKDELVKIYEVNEKLYDSFFDYNGKEVSKRALELKDAIEKISDEKIKNLLKFSADKLSTMTADRTEELNQQDYNIVSMALIHVNSKYDFGKKYNAYSCPMVKKKWLQNTEKDSNVKNPYAAMMRGCGSKDSNF
ncbi:DUF3347 domain-containing protein [Bacteriovorax sp. Seq25_V]|uniref:DUF3347 domain-containing protein n=1 Tax=Bacteriovorax sp. Seq25_V TaxID=1201288 RepID=UPI00038A1645|nr:DUF3347 domain-containing protein [Bacteriovorax sp. Seq25_V]EQC45407.1 PF11827 family protein [Bacteriovorax sp. Seq25_V]